MKPILIILLALFALMQYELWFSPGGLRSVWQLKNRIAEQMTTNQQAQQTNRALAADIADLKRGNEAIEERARNNLGMIKKDETFYQVVTTKKS